MYINFCVSSGNNWKKKIIMTKKTNCCRIGCIVKKKKKICIASLAIVLQERGLEKL